MFLKILDFGLSVGYWVQVRSGGLGRHTAAVGGPIDEDQISTFFKVSLQSFMSAGYTRH